MQVVSVVPSLRPDVNGVGDYGLQLAHRMYQEYGINTSFIVGDPHWKYGSNIDGFKVNWVDRRSPEAVQKILSRYGSQVAGVLVNYVGHGYARGGIPFWLVEGLTRWKQQNPNASLITMFHEIYTVDPWWKPRFWLSFLQKNLISRLVCMSNQCVTNVPAYAQVLLDFSHGKHTTIPVLPVFSNVGEPENVTALERRKRRLVVFGQSRSKRSVYEEGMPALQKVCQLLEIQEILDIGPSSGIPALSVGQLAVIEVGTLSAPEISNILQDSITGFLNYDPTCLTKSGIFAAYCAHGLLPINYQEKRSEWEPHPHEHYLTSNFEDDFSPQSVLLQKIADNAYRWYKSHSSVTQAKLFATYFKGREGL